MHHPTRILDSPLHAIKINVARVLYLSKGIFSYMKVLPIYQLRQIMKTAYGKPDLN